MGIPRNRLPRGANVLGKAVAVNLLPQDLLDARIHMDRVRKLFHRYVDQVEIENHSFCNRVCWFCPNRFYDRRWCG